jgi:hypothetical protein
VHSARLDLLLNLLSDYLAQRSVNSAWPNFVDLSRGALSEFSVAEFAVRFLGALVISAWLTLLSWLKLLFLLERVRILGLEFSQVNGGITY